MSVESNSVPAGPSRDGQPRRSQLGQAVWRIALVAAVLVTALCVVYFTPLKDLIAHPSESTSRLQALGWWSPAVYVVVAVPLVAVGVPRLVLCATAGLAFGFWQGILWAQVATLLGAYATFLCARWGGREAILTRWPSLRKYGTVFGGGGIWAVVLAKQLPINALCMNLLLGITHLDHRAFLLGTLLGTTPEAVAATLAGAGLAQDSPAHSAVYISLALAWFAIAILVMQRLLRRK